jgi:tetratricopeptide (TPR) repeat protein
MERKLYKEAVDKYKKALNLSSRPNLFAKTGFCYMRLNNFDSSQYYYQMVEKIEPKKLIPKMALLQLFEKTKDTTLIMNKAKEIIDLPMNIVTKRGIEIKEYATNILKKIDSISATKILDN